MNANKSNARQSSLSGRLDLAIKLESALQRGKQQQAALFPARRRSGMHGGSRDECRQVHPIHLHGSPWPVGSM